MIRRIHSGGEFEAQAGYCRAVVAGDWVHVAGTVAVPDPTTGVLPDGALAQCKSALDVIENALSQAGASFSNAVRVTYVLPDVAEFDACLPLLRATFGDNPPAAMMLEAGLIDPKYRIEIEVTAYIGA